MSKTPGDHALAVVKAALNVVPLLGGAIASLIGDYIPTATQRTINRALSDLASQLQRLQDRIDPSNIDSDQFSELFKSAYLIMVRTHDERRLHAAVRLLANILLKQRDPEKISYTELDHYARCLEFLSVGAIEVLAHAVASAKLTNPGDLDARSTRLDFSQLQERVPQMSPSLLMGLIGELDAMNLIHRLGAPTVRTPDYANYPLELTPIGAKFTRQILELETAV